MKRGTLSRAVRIVSLALLLAVGCHHSSGYESAPSDLHSTDSSRVLPPAVQPYFQRVLELANREHRLGADARVHGITIGSSSARIDLELGTRVVAVTLVDAGLPSARRARWFGIRPATPLPGEVLGALAAVLDASFAHDPFVGGWAGDRPAESCGSSLNCEEDRMVAEVPHDRGVTSRGVTWLALSVLLAAMLATGIAVLRERPG